MTGTITAEQAATRLAELHLGVKTADEALAAAKVRLGSYDVAKDDDLADRQEGLRTAQEGLREAYSALTAFEIEIQPLRDEAALEAAAAAQAEIDKARADLQTAARRSAEALARADGVTLSTPRDDAERFELAVTTTTRLEQNCRRAVDELVKRHGPVLQTATRIRARRELAEVRGAMSRGALRAAMDHLSATIAVAMRDVRASARALFVEHAAQDALCRRAESLADAAGAPEHFSAGKLTEFLAVLSANLRAELAHERGVIQLRAGEVSAGNPTIYVEFADAVGVRS